VSNARLHRGTLESTAAGHAVDYRVITPPGWTSAARLPLLLVLHGANSAAPVLAGQVPMYEELWADGSLPPVIVGCVTVPTRAGFYIDWPGDGGRWESLVSAEFPAHLQDRFGADPRWLMITGASMGGYGALKIAFRDPGRFAAVAVMAPAVFPAESPSAVGPRNTLGDLQHLLAAMRQVPGRGGDSSSAVERLRAGAGEIRRSGLAILVECGDSDCFNLHDGAEYLHRVLWDLDISHDYRLIRGADHVGPQLADRQRAVLRFLGGALALRQAGGSGAGGDGAGGDGTSGPDAIADYRAWLAAGGSGPAPAIDFGSAQGPAVLRLLLEPQRRAAAGQDTAMARHYGTLRPS
jgi:S-formylglutathione hydrolase